jgi:hypothetical protein
VSGGDVLVVGLVLVDATGVVGAVDVTGVDGAVAVDDVGGVPGDVLVAGESCIAVGVDRLVDVESDFDDDGVAVPDVVPRLVPG